MIELIGFTKRYGSVLAVEDLTFTVAPGRVAGFLGPNGSGKSTTMRAILGLDQPTNGRTLVNGVPYRHLQNPLRVVGSLLDAAAVHPGRRATHHLLAIAQSNGVPTHRVNEQLDLVGLGSVADRRVGSYSLGMRHSAARRVSIAITDGDGHVTVAVDDDGRQPSSANGTGFGLVGMAERVGALGGRLAYGPRPGGGFSVRAVLPI